MVYPEEMVQVKQFHMAKSGPNVILQLQNLIRLNLDPSRENRDVNKYSKPDYQIDLIITRKTTTGQPHSSIQFQTT